MRKFSLVITSFLFFLTGCSLFEAKTAVDLSKLEPYPTAAEGYVRQVIWLAEQPDEQQLKVELVLGINQETDCNIQRFSGQLHKHEVQGWGYSFYELTDVKGPLSTMMACPEGSNRVDFIPVYSENTFIRYNSKLPLVVYTPKNVELRYRIWSAGKELKVQNHE